MMHRWLKPTRLNLTLLLLSNSDGKADNFVSLIFLSYNIEFINLNIYNIFGFLESEIAKDRLAEMERE